MFMKMVTNFGLFSALLFAAGCASNEPVATTYSTPGYGYSSTTHGGEVLSSRSYYDDSADRALEASLRDQLNRYGELASVTPNLQIVARNGAVTLRGSVPNERDRQMIDTCIRNTSGVTSVSDQMQVSYAPTGTYGQSTTVYAPPPSTT